MELGEPDASGRRRPFPIKGSEAIMKVDTVIVAIGRTPNPVIQTVTKGLQTTKHGTIVADPETGETKLHGVFTGGDIMTGEATIMDPWAQERKLHKLFTGICLAKTQLIQQRGYVVKQIKL